MATKVKPCRIKATGTPQAGYVPKYVNEDTFQWGAGGGGGGDVVGPASSTDGHLAVFDGVTGKTIKDGGTVPVVPSNVSAFTNDAGYLTSAPVTSVNSQTGAVVLDADDISDSTTTNKFVTATDKTTWSGKQDALTLPATPTQGHIVTWGANNKTLVDGGAIPSGGGDVLVSSQPNNILTSGMKIWAGEESDYAGLGTYDNNTLYLTIPDQS